MTVEISNIYIERVIIHEIMRQKVPNQKELPRYSEIESSIDDEIRNFLKDKVVKTIGGFRSYDVLFDDDSESPIPGIVENLFSFNDSDFIEYSKKIAGYLNGIQSGRSPGGLVTVIFGNIKGRDIIGILKLEKQEGARLEQTSIGGKSTYDILHLKDLILAEKTKLFKIGMFFKNGLEDFGYDGKVCDNQLSNTSSREVAEFFLTTFLGCNFTSEPKIETKKFFKISQQFFKEKIDDPIILTKYNLHLLSYITNERRTISSRQFAQLNLHLNHRKEYIEYLKEKEVRIGEIIRDTSLIEKRISEMILEFDNGIKIIGNQEGFEENVSLEQMNDGRTKAEIISKLKNIKT